MTIKFTTLLVGSHFHPPAKILLACCADGTRVEFIPEPENPYDSFAMLVGLRPNAISTTALEGFADDLLAYGFDLESVVERDGPWILGHVAAEGGKPLARASAETDRVLRGNRSFVGLGRLRGRLRFDGELVLIEVESAEGAEKENSHVA